MNRENKRYMYIVLSDCLDSFFTEYHNQLSTNQIDLLLLLNPTQQSDEHNTNDENHLVFSFCLVSLLVSVILFRSLYRPSLLHT